MAEKKRRPNRKGKDFSKMTEKEILAYMKKKFTAADLQKYTEPFVGVPAEKVIAEMEAVHRRLSRKGA